jgi:hypothetical protein
MALDTYFNAIMQGIDQFIGSLSSAQKNKKSHAILGVINVVLVLRQVTSSD